MIKLHNAFNPILVYQISDEYKVNKYIYSDVFGVSQLTKSAKGHAYEDPLKLYTTLIKMFKDCDTVFDPFMGSGTTGEACLDLGKTFIGCEIDPNHFEYAKNRLDNWTPKEE